VFRSQLPLISGIDDCGFNKKAQIEAGVPEGIAGTPQGAQFLAAKELDIIKQQRIKDEEQTFLQRLRTATRQPQQFGVPEAQVGGGGLIPEQNLTEGFETTLGQTFLSPEQEAKALTARELPTDIQSNFFSKLLGIKPPDKERKVLKDVAGRQRFKDTGELVFPDVQEPTGKSVLTTTDRKNFTKESLKRFRDAEKDGIVDITLLDPNSESIDESIKGLDKFKAEDTLRNQYIQLSKSFVVIRDAFQQIKTVADQEPSPAGDLSLIFSYMKMLDPTSVIREGEQATAANAKGVPDRIRNIYNEVVLRKPLTPEQRKDFRDTAKRIFKSRSAQQDLRKSEYTRIANNRKLDHRNVIVNLDIVEPKLTDRQKRIKELQDKAKRGQ
jgi:hypothetical protein